MSALKHPPVTGYEVGQHVTRTTTRRAPKTGTATTTILEGTVTALLTTRVRVRWTVKNGRKIGAQSSDHLPAELDTIGTPEVRILTVRQPWAWAIIHGGKDVENRTRNVAGDYRGLVAIHAGLAFDEGAMHSAPLARLSSPWSDGPVAADRVVRAGEIVGLVDLVDVAQNHPSPWAEPGRVHLVLSDPRRLPHPIPYKGALGLRRLPDDVAAAVLAGVGS